MRPSHFSIPPSPILLSALLLTLTLLSQSFAATVRSARYDGSDGARFDFEPRFNRNTQMTIEAWVYRENANRCETVISQGFSDSYWLGLCPLPRFYRSGGSSVDADVDIPARQWTHLAVSYDGTHARFYIDGAPAGTKALANTGASDTGPVYLGRDPQVFGVTAFQFLGSLDEVRLWSTIRTEAQIRDNRFSEIRDALGLEAVWDDGGRRETLGGTAPTGAPTLPDQATFGILPDDLRVPEAAIGPITNGVVDTTTEYAGAEQVVLRYGDGDLTSGTGPPDAVAYVAHTASNLYIGIKGAVIPESGSPSSTNRIDIFLDADGSKSARTESSDIHISAYFDGSAEIIRRGNGQIVPSAWTGHISDLDPFVLTSVGTANEFTLPDIEIRIHRSLLGELDSDWDQTDGIAIAHSSTGATPSSTKTPGDASAISPSTWTTMSYGESNAELPSISVSGQLVDPITGLGISGRRIYLRGTSTIYHQTTTSNFPGQEGEFRFTNRSVPADIPLTVSVALPDDAVTYPPEPYGIGLPPAFTSDTEVRYPVCTFDPCQLQSILFQAQLPIPASELTSTTPEAAWIARTVRNGPPGPQPGGPRRVVAEPLRIYGDNLHNLLEVYLVRPGCPNDFTSPSSACTEGVDYFSLGATPPIDLDGSGPSLPFLQFTLPELPPERLGVYRVVAHDTWARAGNNPLNLSSWKYAPSNITISDPPYPYLYGFHFFNQAGGGSLEEMTAVYGLNMFVDPLFCVPWPHYFAWFPVYHDLSNGEGSCVGISATSRLLYHGDLDITDFDPDAIYPNGHRTGVFDTLNPDAPPEDQRSGWLPPFPDYWTFDFPCRFRPNNLWAEICRNHGVQFSAEMIASVIPQLFGSGSFPDRTYSFDGEPTAVLARVAAAPENYVICMTPTLGSGHCVTPFGVINNARFNRSGETADLPGGLKSDPRYSMIQVYDNNRPDGIRYIEIDRTLNQFRFPYIINDDGDEIYAGRAITAHPLSIWRDGRNMPDLRITEYLHLLVWGSADAMHTDSTGRRWGWDSTGDFHDDIPDVKAITPFSGPDGTSTNVSCYIPNTTTLGTSTLHVREDGNLGFFAAHDSAMFRLTVPGATPGSTAALTFEQQPGGSLDAFSITPSSPLADAGVLIGHLSGTSRSVTLSASSLDLAAGSPYGFSAQRDSAGMTVFNGGTIPLTFDLDASAADASIPTGGTATFTGLTVPAGATQRFTLPNFPAFDVVAVETDTNSDGTYETSSTITRGIPEPVIVVGTQSVTVYIDAEFAGWELQTATSTDGPWTAPANAYRYIQPQTGQIVVGVPLLPGPHFFRLSLP